MRKVQAFLKASDQFGSAISLSHRGNVTYGTILGGCISLLVTIFFA